MAKHSCTAQIQKKASRRELRIYLLFGGRGDGKDSYLQDRQHKEK